MNFFLENEIDTDFFLEDEALDSSINEYVNKKKVNDIESPTNFMKVKI
jgi:hypothetical protein